MLTKVLLFPIGCIMWLLYAKCLGISWYPRWFSVRQGTFGIDAMLMLGLAVAWCITLVVQSGVVDGSMPTALLLHPRSIIQDNYYNMYPALAYGWFPLHTQGEHRTARIATPYTREVELHWNISGTPKCGPALAGHPAMVVISVTNTKGAIISTGTLPLRWGKEREENPRWSTVIPQQDDRTAIVNVTVLEPSPATDQCMRGFGWGIVERVR